MSNTAKVCTNPEFGKKFKNTNKHQEFLEQTQSNKANVCTKNKRCGKNSKTQTDITEISNKTRSRTESY